MKSVKLKAWKKDMVRRYYQWYPRHMLIAQACWRRDEDPSVVVKKCNNSGLRLLDPNVTEGQRATVGDSERLLLGLQL